MAKKSRTTPLYCYKGYYIWQNWNGDGRFTISKEIQESFETLEAAEDYIEQKYFSKN